MSRHKSVQIKMVNALQRQSGAPVDGASCVAVVMLLERKDPNGYVAPYG